MPEKKPHNTPYFVRHVASMHDTVPSLSASCHCTTAKPCQACYAGMILQAWLPPTNLDHRHALIKAKGHAVAALEHTNGPDALHAVIQCVLQPTGKGKQAKDGAEDNENVLKTAFLPVLKKGNKPGKSTWP